MDDDLEHILHCLAVFHGGVRVRTYQDIRQGCPTCYTLCRLEILVTTPLLLGIPSLHEMLPLLSLPMMLFRSYASRATCRHHDSQAAPLSFA